VYAHVTERPKVDDHKPLNNKLWGDPRINGLFKSLHFRQAISENLDTEYLARQSQDLHTKYNVNSVGYRSPEFIANPDIIAIGCSQTFGIGVPDWAVWPKRLADMTGNSYVNLAYSGASIEAQTRSAIEYCTKYGKPKYIVALFPDLYRMLAPVVGGSMSIRDADSRKKQIIDKGIVDVADISFPDQVELPVLSKRPHGVTDILPAEWPLYLSLQAIALLEAYCAAADIHLVFSSWDLESLQVLSRMGVTGGLIEDRTQEFKDENGLYNSTCHEGGFTEFGPNWVIGMDNYEDKEQIGHIGIHRHLDYAEMFADNLEGVVLNAEKKGA
jgi:hypothetical protein